MTSSNEQLVPVEQAKPCPFCGGQPKLIHPMGEWRAGGYLPDGARLSCQTSQCYTMTRAFYGEGMEERAFAAWNTRTPPAVEPDEGLVGLIERLKEGVRNTGMHDDNETELFDVEDADQVMFEAAQKLAAMSPSIRAQALDEQKKLISAAEMLLWHYDRRDNLADSLEAWAFLRTALSALKGGQGV